MGHLHLASIYSTKTLIDQVKYHSVLYSEQLLKSAIFVFYYYDTLSCLEFSTEEIMHRKTELSQYVTLKMQIVRTDAFDKAQHKFRGRACVCVFSFLRGHKLWKNTSFMFYITFPSLIQLLVSVVKSTHLDLVHVLKS